MEKRNRLTRLRLSPRQRQCAQMLAIGYTPKEIARMIGLKARTVNYHLFCARERMQASTFEQLVYYMCATGELPTDHFVTLGEIDQLKRVPFAHLKPAI